MPETKTIDPSLVTEIVRSYVAHNTIAAGELPNLIAIVHRSLAALGTPAETPRPEPAVAINRSYGRDFVICLDCGWRGQMLRRHLTSHALSPEDYRTHWKLKNTHPLTAPAYSERRSALAKQLGFGRSRSAAPAPKPSAPVPAPEPAQAALDPIFAASLSAPSARKRRGRPRASAPPPT